MLTLGLSLQNQVSLFSADSPSSFVYTFPSSLSFWITLDQLHKSDVDLYSCVLGGDLWKYLSLLPRNTASGGNNFLLANGHCLLVPLFVSSPRESPSLTAPLQVMSPVHFWCLSGLLLVFDAMMYLGIGLKLLKLARDWTSFVEILSIHKLRKVLAPSQSSIISFLFPLEFWCSYNLIKLPKLPNLHFTCFCTNIL